MGKPRTLTLSVAQIQSLALKTMGHRPDHEIKLEQPWDDSMVTNFDLFHVHVSVGYGGEWEVRALATERGDNDLLLSSGEMPKFYEWRQV